MLNEMRYHIESREGSPLAGVVLRAMQETGKWDVPSLRQPGFRLIDAAMHDPSLRTAAPLTDRAQIILDQAVVSVGMQRLSFVADLIAEGLTFNLTDPLSVTQLEWNKMNKVGAAQRTMTPSARGENKLPNVLPARLPIYLTTDNFELDIRTLKQSQRLGQPLDTNLIEQCTRSVNEAIEDAGINGATTLDGQPLAVAGYSAPGLVNAPNANTYNITDAAWVTAPVGTTIVTETLAMVAVAQGDNKFGPFNLYVGTVIGNNLQGDFSTTKGEGTIQDRLEKIQAGGRNLRVKVADMMPAGTVALVQMTKDVVDVVVGQPPTVIPWTSLDGFTIYNLVMGIMIPRFRSDYNGQSGIVIGT